MRPSGKSGLWSIIKKEKKEEKKRRRRRNSWKLCGPNNNNNNNKSICMRGYVSDRGIMSWDLCLETLLGTGRFKWHR